MNKMSEEGKGFMDIFIGILSKHIIKIMVLNMTEGRYGPLPEEDEPSEEFYRKAHDDIEYLFDVDIDYSTIKRFKDIVLNSTSSYQALKRALED
jgi:hypothetical protein